MSSKVILPVLGGLSVPGTAIFGFVMSGKYSTDAVLPETFDKFQRDEELENCLLELFPGISNIKKDAEHAETIDGTENKKVDAETFTTSSKTSGTSREGCLMVNWDREYSVSTSERGKGRGNGRVLWAMKNVDKGFIVFNTLTTARESGAGLLKWDGEGYVLDRDKTSRKGKIKMKQHVETDKKITKSQVASKFPKAKDDLAGMKGHDLGDFMGSKDAVDNICNDETECKTTKHTKSPFRGYGKGKEDSASETTADKGSSTTEQGGKEIYTTNKWDMVKALTEFKGSGEQVYISGLKPKKQDTQVVQ